MVALNEPRANNECEEGWNLQSIFEHQHFGAISREAIQGTKVQPLLTIGTLSPPN